MALITGDPISSVAVDQQGLDTVPSTESEALGAEFTGGFESSIGPRIARSMARGGITSVDPEATGLADVLQDPAAQPAPSPMLSPGDANAKYGIKGVLSFDQPVTDAAAADLYQAKHSEALRQDLMNRAPKSFAIRTAASVVGNLMDPTNLALGLIPGVGEEYVASRLGGGLLGGLAGRAVQGATAGAFGMAALQPAEAFLDSQEHGDWSMAQALRDIAFGGVLGGGLHMALGGFGKAAAPVAERIEAAGPEAREALLQGSLGQLMDDRPVTAGPALDALDADRALTELRTWTDQQQRIDADSDAALQASQVPAAPDLSGQIGAASDQLSALQATAEGFRSDIAGARENTLRSAMDPATAERLAEVEGELNGVIPSARRADLERERTMLLEGRNADQDIQVASGDLEVARGQAETRGLQAGADRADAAVDQAQAALQRLQDQDAAARGAAVDQQGIANRALAIQSARLTSREAVVQALAARTIRRLAGRAGVALDDGEADALARRVLREGMSPQDAVSGIIDRSGTLPEARTAEAPGADPVAALQSARASAIDDLHAATMQDDPERATVSASADQAVAKPSGGLADIQAQIADLEARRRPAPTADNVFGGERDAAIDAAQAGVDEAEQQAGAIEQAASCLRRAGI